MPCEQFALKCFNFQEMTKTYKCSESSRTLCHRLTYVHVMIICHWQYCITICHSKQLQEGLMVFSDDFLLFLKIKKKKLNSSKLSCGFNTNLFNFMSYFLKLQ